MKVFVRRRSGKPKSGEVIETENFEDLCSSLIKPLIPELIITKQIPTWINKKGIEQCEWMIELQDCI